MGTTQDQFSVGGMACSFCTDSIEKAYRRLDGVDSVDVSLAHEEVLVRYDDSMLTEVELKDTLRDLGYTIRDPDKQTRFEEQAAELAAGKHRLRVAGAASILTAGLMSWMIGVEGRLESASLAMDLATLFLALGTMFGPGRYILEKAHHSLRRGILNQHVLLEAGAIAGLLGGFLGLFIFPDFPTVHFFAVSVFITTYHILSEYTSLLVRTRASQAVQRLLDLRPDTARRVTGGHTEEVPVEKLSVGDQVRVKPGENVPVDGTVVEGHSTVDESVATGESMPAEKQVGDDVIGGSVNETGTLLVEVTATGEDAFLSQVAREVEEARAMQPGIIQVADQVLRYFVPSVLAIAAASVLFWLLVPTLAPGTLLGSGPQVQTGIFAGLAVLVLGYPCALGMATPLALIRGGGEAATRGILMRSGDAFQIFPDIDSIFLDKTGTITRGEPVVADVLGITAAEDEVVAVAASAEAFSDHPLADAILDSAHESSIDVVDPETFDSVTGNGVRATLDGSEVLVGKPEWLQSEGIDISRAIEQIQAYQSRGLTVSGVTRDGVLLGLVALGDEIKADAAATVQRIQDAGIRPVMITGDNERTADAVGAEIGIDRVMADVLPREKRLEIARVQEANERVAMVGDGINDAPALTQADIGIAISAGTDIAIESAEIVLMGDRLGGVMDAYEIGQESYRRTRQNLAAAFTFNGVGIAAATTGLVHPIFAMLAMILSVTAVLANSFAGQLGTEEGLTTDFSLQASSPSTAQREVELD